MANVYQPKLLQVRTQYDSNPDTGEHPENVLWFQSASAGVPTIAQLTTMATVFDGVWANCWTNMAPSNRHYNGSIWTDWSSATGLSYNSVGAFSPAPGLLSAAVMPSQVAVLISLSNGERYKGGHFRIYLPYVAMATQLSTDTNKITSTVLNNVSTGFANINAATTASGVLGGQTQQLYRHRNNAALAALFQIHSFQVSQTYATQRRRIRKAPHR